MVEISEIFCLEFFLIYTTWSELCESEDWLRTLLLPLPLLRDELWIFPSLLLMVELTLIDGPITPPGFGGNKSVPPDSFRSRCSSELFLRGLRGCCKGFVSSGAGISFCLFLYLKFISFFPISCFVNEEIGKKCFNIIECNQKQFIFLFW